jgi:hypothetical protein
VQAHTSGTGKNRAAEFVCIFGTVFKRVSGGQKISALNFKISGSDFEIRATNFFLAPTRGLSAENQFSLFTPRNRHFRPHFSPIRHASARLHGVSLFPYSSDVYIFV